MMNQLYLLTCRMYDAGKRRIIDPLLDGHPRAQQKFIATKAWVKLHFFPSREMWVQVEAGAARGTWMHIRLPEENGLWSGRHEPYLQEMLPLLLRPGDSVYDIGAHLGTITFGMAKLAGATGKVVAFEADPTNVARLEKICVRNGLQERVRVVHAAVWSRTAQDGIDFRKGIETSYGGVESDGQRPVLATGELIRVPAITLDDFVAEGAPPPELIKVDVEGGEYEVLHGGALLFGTKRPVVIVEVHTARAAEKIAGWLEEFGYAAEWYRSRDEFPHQMIARPQEQ